MKRELEIKLSKNDVYTEVQKLTAYTGVKSSEGYSQNYVKDSQTEALDAYWETVVNTIGGNCRQYIIGEDRSDEGYTSYLQMPWNWIPSLGDSINSDCRTFAVYYITGMWMRVVLNSNGDKYLEDADAMLLSLRTKLNSRQRPTKPWNPADEEKNPHWFGVNLGKYDDRVDKIITEEK